MVEVIPGLRKTDPIKDGAWEQLIAEAFNTVRITLLFSRGSAPLSFSLPPLPMLILRTLDAYKPSIPVLVIAPPLTPLV